MQTISVGEAKSRFSELISRTAAGERFLIQRRQRPVAVLISAPELERLERASRAARRLALALVTGFAMGVDFPNSNARFSRLAGAD